MRFHYSILVTTHLELDSLVVLHADLEVDGGLGGGLGGQADVELVLAKVVGGEALVGGVVGVVHRLYGQG